MGVRCVEHGKLLVKGKLGKPLRRAGVRTMVLGGKLISIRTPPGRLPVDHDLG
jgi:hypothetical protein